MMTYKERNDLLKEAAQVLTACREWIPSDESTRIDDRIVACRDGLEKWRREMTWQDDEQDGGP